MSAPMENSQGLVDTLSYLQHHLQELTKRQNTSKNNVNTALASLIVQLQQLTQLVSHSSSTLVVNTSLPPVSQLLPLLSLAQVPFCLWVQPKLPSLSDFNREQNHSQTFLNSCTLYIQLVLEQFDLNLEWIF